MWMYRSCLLTGLAALLAGVLICLRGRPAFAFGQLPLMSEDPTSPCAGVLNTDVGYALDWVGQGQTSSGQQVDRSHIDMAAPVMQLNYGITDRIQARVEDSFPVTTVAPINGKMEAGFGDVTAGMKYRLMDQVDGLEYDDTCKPAQYKSPYGLRGLVSVSIFPQFTIPTGSENLGLGDGQYSMELPVDVARKIGKLYLVGEGDFVWNYHDRTTPNELQMGLAAYYSLTDYLDLLGEERLNFLTAGRGPSLWMMNVGAEYYLNDHFAIFGAVGTSVAGTSTVAPSYLTTIFGTDINLPTRW
jgi:hypothetical protein